MLDTLGFIREEMERINEELQLAQERNILGWVEEGDYPSNRPNGSSNSSNSDKPWGDKYDGLETESERAEYRDKQLKKIIELGNEMDRTPSSDKEKIKSLKQQQEAIAKTIGAYNQGGTWYIMIGDKKYRVRDAVGVRHSGIETGFVGGKALSKGSRDFMELMRGEELNILKAGEIVVNPKQMDNVVNNIIPNMLNRNSKTPQLKIEGDLCSIVINGNADKDVIKLLRKETDKIANYTLDKIKSAMNLGY